MKSNQKYDKQSRRDDLKARYKQNPVVSLDLASVSISWKTHPARLIRKEKISRLEQSRSNFAKDIYVSGEDMDNLINSLS